MKDLYHVLGVSEDATQAEVRTAYRRRARAVHPDCSEEDGKLFRELQEAYDVLGDPVRRKAYDRQRRPAAARRRGFRRKPSRPPASPYADSEGSTLLSELRRHFGHTAGPGRPSSGSRSLNLQARITPREARRGGRLRFRLLVPKACGRCGGSGLTGFYHCAGCRGTGMVREQIPVAISFPAGTRDGQQADLSLAPLGFDDLHLSLTFTISS